MIDKRNFPFVSRYKKETSPKSLGPSDLLCAGNLAIDAIKGITGIVEEMHYTIVSFGGLLGNLEQRRTKGLTALVYRSIHNVSELAGSSIDAMLAKHSLSLTEQKNTSPNREAIVAALNGILGDHLALRKNPLAITMQLRQNGKTLTQKALVDAIRRSHGKLVVMVHGVCMNDLQWNQQGHDHGASLARDLGYFPLYLHYNSGLHISENGKKLSELLESMVRDSPQPIDLVIVGHSMGGLITRSACYYANTAGYSWPCHLHKIIFLGTPHQGAPLERAGNWVDIILQAIPYSAPFSRLGKIRSAGITDLRYGNILDCDWKERDRFILTGDQRTPVPLPTSVQCFAIAASTSKQPGKLADYLIGDGMVPLNSALGRHKVPQMRLYFPENHQWIGYRMNHLALLSHPDVYATIKKWLAT